MKTPTIILLWAAAIATATSQGHAADATEADGWFSTLIGGGGNIPCPVIHPKVRDVMDIGADVGAVDRWDPEHERWIPTLNVRGAPRGCDASWSRSRRPSSSGHGCWPIRA